MRTTGLGQTAAEVELSATDRATIDTILSSAAPVAGPAPEGM
jgi:hypothetical protein